MTESDSLGFEKKLFEAADKLRSNMDAAEYKHVVLGLVFLKYISDSFEELFGELLANPEADEEDEDEYIAKKVFWVPKNARWGLLKANARQPEIGQIIDDAMRSIEKCNPSLKGVLTKDYARPTLDKIRLGELIDLIGTIGLGDRENASKDILGRVYEYFLGEFASLEGKKGGQFYTPRSVVRLLVEMIRPFKGRIYDPCCGSGGMFVQSDFFLKEHGKSIENLSIYAQESNPTTWKLFKMNMAIRRISANIGSENADTFGKNLHPDLRADFILANPPFNIKDWGQENLVDDKRWEYGTPPNANANFAWLQHMIHHLSNSGQAGVVLANGAHATTKKGQDDIRKSIIEGDLLDCVVALPNSLFFNTGIPASLWFLNKNKSGRGQYRDRRKETLFIDARRMGHMINRVQREFSNEDIHLITSTYRAWIGDPDFENAYNDEWSFCRSVNIDEIEKQQYRTTPGRYVGAPKEEDSSGEGLESLCGSLFDSISLCNSSDEELKKLLGGFSNDI